jgi:hypothetical protein
METKVVVGTTVTVGISDGVTGSGVAEGVTVDRLHDTNTNDIKAVKRLFIGFTSPHFIPALEVK